jgi:penicillin amidase
MLRNSLAGSEVLWIEKRGGLMNVLVESLAAAMDTIGTKNAQQVRELRWGDEHQLVFSHPLSSQMAVLEWIFNPESYAVGGRSTTVMAAASTRRESSQGGTEGIVTHGASWRFVIDLADMSRSYHIVGPGQSGHVKSPWYHDQMEDWVNGEYHTTVMNANKVQGGKILTLAPSE